MYPVHVFQFAGSQNRGFRLQWVALIENNDIRLDSWLCPLSVFVINQCLIELEFETHCLLVFPE